MQNVNVLWLAISWGVLVLIVVGLIFYRKSIANQEDDGLHVLEPVTVAAQQTAVVQKLDHIDRWGKLVTALTVVYGLAIVVLWFYQYWIESSKAAMQ